jgi:beta-glucosidase/6-phospho-beta-glucosidase/beta-galactosidase
MQTQVHAHPPCRSPKPLKPYQKPQGGKIGITINSDYKQQACTSEQDAAAAERAQIFVMGWFADPVFFGDYPKEMREACGDRLPHFTAEEKALLKGSLDFLGLNHYTTALVSAPLFRVHGAWVGVYIRARFIPAHPNQQNKHDPHSYIHTQTNTLSHIH